MKHSNTKRNIILSIMIAVSIALLIINYIPPLVINAGWIKEFKGYISSDQAIYINQNNPDTNYKSKAGFYSRVTYIGNLTETYIHFSLSSLPEKAERIGFLINGFEENYEVNLILVNSNYNISEVTWNNRPNHEEIISKTRLSEIYQRVTRIDFYFDKAVDVTDAIEKNELNELILCINVTDNNGEVNVETPIEGFRLVWQYYEVILSYTTIFSTLIVLIMLIGIIFILRYEIDSCPKCSAKKVYANTICPKCNFEFNVRNLNRKRIYYKTILFIEGVLYVMGILLFPGVSLATPDLVSPSPPIDFFEIFLMVSGWSILFYFIIKRTYSNYIVQNKRIKKNPSV